MADANHYDEAADGLETAAKALRACADEESDEQPTNLRDAAKTTKRLFARSRKERDSKARDSADDDSR